MFEYYTVGTRVQTSGAAGELHDRSICPKELPSEASPSRQPARNSRAPTPTTTDSVQPSQPIDNLVHGMNRQVLRPDVRAIHRPSPRHSTASSSSKRPVLKFRDDIIDAPLLEADDNLESDAALLNEEVEAVAKMFTNSSRIRRQRDSAFNNNPYNADKIQSLVQDMITTGTQCNVYEAPLNPSPPTASEAAGSEATESEPGKDVSHDAPLIAADDPTALARRTPDLDEGFCEDGDENIPLYGSMSLAQVTRDLQMALGHRHGVGPDDVLKQGRYPHLSFRTSHEVATSCRTVIRSTPRLRKRARTTRPPKDPETTPPT